LLAGLLTFALDEPPPRRVDPQARAAAMLMVGEPMPSIAARRFGHLSTIGLPDES
jgi:hypothetical protein